MSTTFYKHPSDGCIYPARITDLGILEKNKNIQRVVIDEDIWWKPLGEEIASVALFFGDFPQAPSKGAEVEGRDFFPTSLRSPEYFRGEVSYCEKSSCEIEFSYGESEDQMRRAGTITKTVPCWLVNLKPAFQAVEAFTIEGQKPDGSMLKKSYHDTASKNDAVLNKVKSILL